MGVCRRGLSSQRLKISMIMHRSETADTTEAEAESADEKMTMALGFPNKAVVRTDSALFPHITRLLLSARGLAALEVIVRSQPCRRCADRR